MCLICQVHKVAIGHSFHPRRPIRTIFSEIDLGPQQGVVFVSASETERHSQRPINNLLDKFAIFYPWFPCNVFHRMDVSTNLIDVFIRKYTSVWLCTKSSVVINSNFPFFFLKCRKTTIKIVEVSRKFHHDPFLLKTSKQHFQVSNERICLVLLTILFFYRQNMIN